MYNGARKVKSLYGSGNGVCKTVSNVLVSRPNRCTAVTSFAAHHKVQCLVECPVANVPKTREVTRAEASSCARVPVCDGRPTVLHGGSATRSATRRHRSRNEPAKTRAVHRRALRLDDGNLR